MTTSRARLSDYLFLAPYLAFFLVFLLFPILYGFGVSFSNLNLIEEKPLEWAGFSNYSRALTNADFWKAAWVTLKFVLYTVPALMMISLMLALCLRHAGALQSSLRAILFFPLLLSVPVVSILWLWLYNPEYGLFNEILKKIGLNGILWLSDTRWALLSIAVATLWWTFPMSTVIYLAAILRIPRSYYEACRIDGATAWSAFAHITWPLLRPLTIFLFIINTIASFQVFGQTYIMSAGPGGTSGGPAGQTLVLVHYIYEQAFQLFELGYGAAVGFLLFVAMAMASALQWIAGHRRQEEWE